MAVRLEPSLPAKFSSTIEKPDETTKSTLDHVERILSDHDYLKHTSPSEVNNKKTAIVENKVHVGQKNVQSDIQGHSEACSSRDSKGEKMGELANEGIQARDLCSLLDKFEEATGNSPSILTPATSPGRFENWIEPLSLKINSHVNATDLTPPTTPPVQEQPEQKLFQNDCKPSAKLKKETSKFPAKKNIVNKSTRKAEDMKCTTATKKVKSPPVISKKVQQNTAKVGSASSGEHTKQEVKLAERNERENNASKRKCKDTIPDSKDMVSSAKKIKIHAENENQKKHVQLSKNCQESKIELPEMKDTVNESSEKIVKGENTVEKPSNEVNESLNMEICPNVLIEGKLPELNRNEKNVEQPNDVKELLNDETCSNLGDVTEEKLPKLNSNKDDEHDKVRNYNNNEERKVDIPLCRTVNNNAEMNIEKMQNNVHLNESHKDDNYKDDDHKRKSRDTEETTKRKSEQYHEVYNDDRRKRKHRSRSTSSDEDSREEERSNPRKSERYHESVRHSCDNGRRKEKYRKYSSRDDYDRKYSDEERRRHRKYDDDRHHSKYDDRKQKKYIRDVEQERKIDFRLGRSNIKDVAKGERRVIYVGGLPYGTTRDELRNRFRKFGPIEKVTVHLRVGERDNYGFVTFFEPDDARDCVERGNSDPSEPQFDLCFGGRRQFCGGSYVDFDSTTSRIEELSETYGKVCDEIPEEDDFDSLLRMCQEGLSR